MRDRTIDDPRFVVEVPGRVPTSFRLQVFTASGLRPVVLLTQAAGSEGDSVINQIERCTEAIWRRCCPGEVEPPIVVAQPIMEAGTAEEKSLGLHHVKLTGVGPYTVARPPRWGGTMSGQALDYLVGQAVDVGRGPFTTAPRPAEPRQVLRPAWVLLLPVPELDEDDPPCLDRTLPWPRRLAAQLHPSRADAGCCWYHGGDWHRVCRVALSAVRRAHETRRPHAGEPEPDLIDDDALRATVQTANDGDLTGWEREALASLFLEPIDVSCEDGGFYVNGRHRIHAVMSAGVSRVPVARWVSG